MHYPDFVDDKAYLEMDSSVSELEQSQAMLANLTRIHLLTANKFSNFDELIREYIISGIEIFGLETGIVSRIDEDEVYHVCDVVSPLTVLEKDQQFPLEDTYCREVVKSQSVLGFPEVGNLEYMNCHPVYQNLQLESYLSAPIYVDSKLFGTLNFTSTHKRSRGFSKNEHNMILLMANSIGAYILLRQKEDRLKELNDKMKQFVGYVAHDLRNPIGSIIGFAKMASKPTCSVERSKKINLNILKSAEQALEFVSTILDNAALSSGKLHLNIEKVELHNLVTEAIDDVQQFSYESNITIQNDINKDIYVNCDKKRIRQSLMNLLINAVKYSPAGSTILLSAKQNSEKYLVSISNKIDSAKQTEESTENSNYSSVGFGLDIVREVLQAHGEDLNTQTSDDGIFTAEFLLATESRN